LPEVVDSVLLFRRLNREAKTKQIRKRQPSRSPEAKGLNSGKDDDINTMALPVRRRWLFVTPQRFAATSRRLASQARIATRLHGLLREFGDDNGVLWIDQSEDSLRKAMELVNEGNIETDGEAARHFVRTNDWATVVDEFEQVLQDASDQREASLMMRGTPTAFRVRSKSKLRVAQSGAEQ
jgi:hypothetical protein